MRPLGSFVLAIVASASMLAASQVTIDPNRDLPPLKGPQEPVATFRAGVRAIQLDAVVTDQDGNPVRGLTVDDFEITERGQLRPITTFEAVDIPIETQPPDLADTDVVTNEGEGRVYLIVFDALSDPVHAQLAKRELRTFFDRHFGPNDTAAVMFLDKAHATSGQDFTSNRRLLLKGIDSAVGDDGVVEPGSASPFASSRRSSSTPLPDTVVTNLAQGQFLARNRMSRLKDLTEFLVKIPGRRKAMLLISEAIGFDGNDFKDYAGTTLSHAAEDAHAAMTAATRGNIAIYPIDPRGVTPDFINLESAMELRTVAAATGGFAHVNSNNYGDSFTRLVQEQSVYYMLAFNSGEDKDNGRYVPVKVTVKRPGMRVLAREGYVAPFKGKDTFRPADRRPGVATALGSPVSVAGVPLRAVAVPFKGTGKTASILVALDMDPHGLGLAERPDGSMRGSVEVRMVATDVRSKPLPQSRQAGEVVMRGSARNDPERRLHVLTRTNLPAGRYQLRIAVGTAQRGGSVIYDLDVPDYTKNDLAMSGVVLRGSSEPDGMFLPAGDPLRSLSKGAPTTIRAFENTDSVSVYAEIYDTTSDRPHSIDVKSEIRSESGELTPVATVSRSSADLKSTGGTLRLDTPLPLATLAPGRYVLSVDVKSTAGGDTVTRRVPFQVR
jgi:VWFA-related protein